MFCKNCGNPMDPMAAVCVKCGAARDTGSFFCGNCGQQLPAGSAVCLSCGAPTQTAPMPGAKSKLAAGLLAIFLGQFGVHNFYLGYTKNALIQLLVSVLLAWTGIAPLAMWIWAIVEAVKIFNGEMPDANGNRLAN